MRWFLVTLALTIGCGARTGLEGKRPPCPPLLVPNATMVHVHGDRLAMAVQPRVVTSAKDGSDLRTEATLARRVRQVLVNEAELFWSDGCSIASKSGALLSRMFCGGFESYTDISRFALARDRIAYFGSDITGPRLHRVSRIDGSDSSSYVGDARRLDLAIVGDSTVVAVSERVLRLRGDAVDDFMSTGTYATLAVDDGFLYVLDARLPASIRRLPAGGGPIETVADLAPSTALAFAVTKGTIVAASFPRDEEVDIVRIEGGQIQTLAICPRGSDVFDTSIDSDGTFAYFTTTDGLRRIPLHD